MNLSAVSTEDLLALKAGDLSKVSTVGLRLLKGETVSGADAIPRGPGDMAGPSATNPIEDISKATLWQKLQGGREAVGNLVSSALLSPITVPLSAAGKEDWAAKFQNAMQPPPTTPTGREYLGNAAQFLGTHGASLTPMASIVARGQANAARRTLTDAEAASSVKSFTPAQIAAARSNPALEGIVAARDAGLTMPPTAAGGGLLTRTMEGLSGAPKAEKLLSQKNAPVFNKLAKEYVGMSQDTPLTRDTVRGIREQAGEAYAPIKAAGELPVSQKFFDDIKKASTSYDTAATSFEDVSVNPFEKVRNGLIGTMVDGKLVPRKSFDAASAVERVKLLRAEADKAYAGRDKALGQVYRDLANALDEAIDAGLDTKVNPELKGAVDRYRDARQTIAKTYLVDEALNSTTGNVNANVFAQALKKGKPLSGPGLQIAKFATQFEKASQRVEKTGNAGSPTLFDAWAALHGGLTTGMLGARPAARHLLASDFMQNRMTSGTRELLNASRRSEQPPGISAAALKDQLNTNWLGDLTPDWQTSLGAGGVGRSGIDAAGLYEKTPQQLPQGMPVRPGSQIPALTPSLFGDLTPGWQTSPGAGGGGLFGGIDASGLYPALGDARVGTSRLKGRPQMPVQSGLLGVSDTAIAGYSPGKNGAPRAFTDIAEGALPKQNWSPKVETAVRRLLERPRNGDGAELSSKIMAILNEPSKGKPLPDQIMAILNEYKGQSLADQISAILRGS